METIFDFVKEMLQDRNVTLTKFADTCGLSRQSIMNALKCESYSPIIRYKIARELGYSNWELLYADFEIILEKTGFQEMIDYDGFFYRKFKSAGKKLHDFYACSDYKPETIDRVMNGHSGYKFLKNSIANFIGFYDWDELNKCFENEKKTCE